MCNWSVIPYSFGQWKEHLSYLQESFERITTKIKANSEDVVIFRFWKSIWQGISIKETEGTIEYGIKKLSEEQKEKLHSWKLFSLAEVTPIPALFVPSAGAVLGAS